MNLSTLRRSLQVVHMLRRLFSNAPVNLCNHKTLKILTYINQEGISLYIEVNTQKNDIITCKSISDWMLIGVYIEVKLQSNCNGISFKR